MDSYRRFEEDTKRYWEEMLSPARVSRFSEGFKEDKPNHGRHALAELEATGTLKALVT